MGWGYQHTPFYIPDPTDPYDVAETAVSHAAWAGASWAAAYAISGVNPGPGHLGILYRSFLSRAHVGAAYAGTNAFDDTMFALRVYGTPFRIAARVLAPLSAVVTVAEVGRSLAGEGHVHRSREWLDEYNYQLAGGDFQEQIAELRASR